MDRAKFISGLALENEWRRGAELGVWHGRTLSTILAACPDLYMVGVDAWEHIPNEMDHYTSWDHDAHYKQALAAVAPYIERVQLLRTTTRRASWLVADGSLDFIFIDADHRTAAVTEDIVRWSPKVKRGGMIMGHDIDWETVKIAVEHCFDSFETGPDKVWYVNA